ncbi:MAG: hypothetical protein ACFE0Q_10860 [Anaerolineae bacterium]
MNKLGTFLYATLLLIFSVWSTQAQNACDIDVDRIIQRVTDACTNIGENEVCYGNRNVNAVPRINTIDFVFDAPGDRVGLSNIRSLVVDAIDTSEDNWGVAQMRLLLGSESGARDINMLLFGDFEIENAVSATSQLELRVITMQMAIYREPLLSSAEIDRVPSNTILTAVARLEDNSWIRVENPQTRVIGWIENNGFVLSDEALSLGILPIQDASTPYFGAMQAFYFENGQSNIGCDTVESDGLLIQTPEGTARVSLLINEVSIELLGGRNEAGENEGGTALIQANPLSGMSVNVVQGQATVTTEEGEQVIERGQQSSIPISVDLRPSGAPSVPAPSEPGTVNIAPLVPAVSPANVNNNNNTSTGTIGINTNGNGSGNNDDGGTSTGTTVNPSSTGSSGDGGNNSNGSSTSGDTNNSSSTGNNSGGSNNGNNPDTRPDHSNGTAPDLPGDIGTEQSQNTGAFQGLGEQGNIIALGVTLTGGLSFILFLVWYTRRNKS